MLLSTTVRRLIVPVCATTAAWTAGARGEDAPPDAPRCSVVTVAPGDALDALFGHTAIRIRDPKLPGGDVWFDYGVFDPSDWTFWIHYAKGDARYMMVAADPESRLDWYKKEGRGVVEQELALTPAEAQKLEDLLIEDLRFGCGRKGYVYRFLDDNCTTRVVKAIAAATGREAKPASAGSFRNYSDLYLCRNPLAQLGANLLMGSHAEAPTRVFLPDQFHASIEEDRLEGNLKKYPDEPGIAFMGLAIELNQKADVLRHTQAIMLDISWGLFALCALPTLLRWKKRKPLPSRGWLDAPLFAFVGLIGALMVFLEFWSLHPELGAFNWNLIWCWPAHLLFAAGLLLFPRSPKLRLYARVAAVGTGLAALGYFFVPQALPIPLFPLVLLLGLRAARWGWPPASDANKNLTDNPWEVGPPPHSG